MDSVMHRVKWQQNTGRHWVHVALKSFSQEPACSADTHRLELKSSGFHRAAFDFKNATAHHHDSLQPRRIGSLFDRDWLAADAQIRANGYAAQRKNPATECARSLR